MHVLRNWQQRVFFWYLYGWSAPRPASVSWSAHFRCIGSWGSYIFISLATCVSDGWRLSSFDPTDCIAFIDLRAILASLSLTMISSDSRIAELESKLALLDRVDRKLDALNARTTTLETVLHAAWWRWAGNRAPYDCDWWLVGRTACIGSKTTCPRGALWKMLKRSPSIPIRLHFRRSFRADWEWA